LELRQRIFQNGGRDYNSGSVDLYATVYTYVLILLSICYIFIINIIFYARWLYYYNKLCCNLV